MEMDKKWSVLSKACTISYAEMVLKNLSSTFGKVESL
jgi:hypothetical protein